MATVRSCDRCGQPMEDVGSEHVPTRETGHDVHFGDRRARLRCSSCGYEEPPAETVSDGEVESWENEGGCVIGSVNPSPGQ